ncbi:hypothetical protein GTC6_20755 [Gordonia terrae C-6]|uniref:Cellulose biosynthesis cyclic di-GMP-binding regulatory protein BcsB n=1 Tax=Gordonia terrae C-6 TaxID=1316928 RepID=R7Y428_9ACTN|nr:hypothetical protein GTC6_20755 [Gordonia terrae C-6]
MLVAALIVGVAAVAPASAAPGDGSTTLSWQQLGMGSSVSIDSADVSVGVSIPVPEGMSPTRLTGVVASATNVSDAFIQVARTDGTIVGTVRVPRFGPQQLSTPFTVPLAAVPVGDNGRADLRLTLRNSNADAVCGPIPDVSLTGLNVAYSGTASVPGTIQDVFGTVVSSVTVYTPVRPSAAVSQTALGVVAAIADHYRPQRVSIQVVENAGAGIPRPGDPLDRAVVIREAGGAGEVRLEGGGRPDATLVISGDAGSLPDQVALFREGLTGLAQTTSVAVESVRDRDVQGSDTVTFGDFSDRLSAEVLGATTLVPGFDPTMLALGRPGAVDVHLRARYTPVRADERANVLAVSGGEVLHTSALDASGVLDTQFTIPAAQVAANEPLEFRISYEPAPGACSPRSVPLTFQIDPSSSASSSTTPVRMGGFSSVPLGWQPTVQVALDNTNPSQLNAAAQLIASVQRSSATALSPVLVPLDQAITSGTGALVIADAANARPLDPPINTEDTSTLVDLSDQVRLAIPNGLGSIQAFAQNSRTVVLVTTSGSWDLVDPLFAYLDDQEGDLANLRGDVLVAGRAGQTELMTVRADGPQAEVDQVGTNWVVWLGVSVAAVVIGVLVAVVVMLYRRRFGDSNGPAGSATS